MKIAIQCLLLLLAASSSSSFSSPISLSEADNNNNNNNNNNVSMGRNLLQAHKPCPLNLESMNYTIITSRCKGPNYPADICCQALKDFACPFANQLDDLSNDCSTVMFSYINRYGNYPPGIFSSLCHGDNVGLVCDGAPPPPPPEVDHDHSNDTLMMMMIANPSSLLILSTGLFMVLLFL